MNCNDSMINNSILKKRDDPGRNFQILAISNRHLCTQPFEDQIKRVCEWHPDALILREKDLPEDEYKALAKSILDICKAYDVPCILHTYWKAALELGHDATASVTGVVCRVAEAFTKSGFDNLAEFSCYGLP